MKRRLQQVVQRASARLPDLSRVPVRRQVAGGLIASVLLHVVLLGSLAVIEAVLPDRRDRIGFTNKAPRMQELEVELMPPPPSVQIMPFTLAPPEKMYIDSAGLAQSAVAPERPLFEADQDMIAASELAPTGDAPLPTQMGADRTFTNFRTQTVLLGKTPRPFPADVSLANAAPAPVQQPIAAVKPEPPRETPPEPKTAQAPPPPSPLKTSTPPPEEIPLSVPPPPPAPVVKVEHPPPPPRPTPNREPEPPQDPQKEERKMAMLTTPPPRPQPVRPPEPAPPKQPGYQPQLEQTRIEGGISNRGKAAVDAVRTPLGVYKKHISEAVGSRWYHYIKQRMDLITVGTVTINFAITAEGRVQDVRVVSNTGNQSLANVCEQSVREAEIKPPPPDTLEHMRGGRLEVPFTFTFYDPH